MALKRIYDQTVGQLAGLLVSTTGKGQITNDGQEAWAQVVGLVSDTGSQIDPATETTLQAAVDDLDLLVTASQDTSPVAVSLTQGEYETVAASQTAQVLGATGAVGDYLAGILVTPATTSPGNVIILDNATSITVFTGGAASVSNLVPFFITLGIFSVSGAWKVTTGSNVSVIGIGNFT